MPYDNITAIKIKQETEKKTGLNWFQVHLYINLTIPCHAYE